MAAALPLYVIVAIVVFYCSLEQDTFGEAFAVTIFWPVFLLRSLYRGFVKVWREQ